MFSFLSGKTEEKASSGAVSAAAPSESEPAATAAKKEEAPEPAAAASAAGAQQAPVERQDSRQGKQRLAKTNSSGSGGQSQASQGDNRAARAQEPVRQGPGSGQQRPAHKRTEGPKSPVTSAKWHQVRPGVMSPPV